MDSRTLFQNPMTGWPALIFGVAMVSGVMTWAHIAVARKLRFVAPTDPWHDRPVAHSGGVAVWIAILCASGFLGLFADPLVLRILLAGAMLAVIGFIDDRRPFQPSTKLVLQLGVSATLVATSWFYTVGDIPRVVALPVAVVWLVGQSNAVNLMDNMDGSCPTVVGISALGIAALQSTFGSPALSLLCLVIAGASFGFLAWNRRPARVFLGDTGSLSLGFVLAAVAMYGSWIGPGATPARAFVPLLLLIVPLFNTVFVILTRYDAGVPVSRGLSDHINYRLVGHGLSLTRTLLILGSLALTAAGLAWSFWKLSLLLWGALTALFALGIASFGIFLSHVDVEKVYTQLNVPRTPLPPATHHTRRRLAFEMLSDALVAGAAYFLSFELRFEGDLSNIQEENFAQGLPFLLLAGVFAMWINGLYKTLWKYVGMNEVLKIGRAAMLAGIALLLVTQHPRFNSFPRSIYFLFPMVFVVLATAYRLAPRALYSWKIRSPKETSRGKALIVGAGDAGELALRDIRNGAMQGLSAYGFLDDDPKKLGREIHGVPVLAPTSALVSLIQEHDIKEVIVAMPSAHPDTLATIVRACEGSGLKPRFFLLHPGITQLLVTA